MAKTGFWLKGATGKLAGAALQKGANGETIMREIVTPKNPQTEAQMIQRIVVIIDAYVQNLKTSQGDRHYVRFCEVLKEYLPKM